MSSGGGAGSAAISEVPAVRKMNSLRVVWDFTRPHTIVGSVLSVMSLHLFAAGAPGERCCLLEQCELVQSFAPRICRHSSIMSEIVCSKYYSLNKNAVPCIYRACYRISQVPFFSSGPCDDAFLGYSLVPQPGLKPVSFAKVLLWGVICGMTILRHQQIKDWAAYM